MIRQFFPISINLIQDSKGGSRIEIIGSMTIDWGSYQRGENLLDCLVFGDPDEPLDANTPDINEICTTVP